MPATVAIRRMVKAAITMSAPLVHDEGRLTYVRLLATGYLSTYSAVGNIGDGRSAKE